MPERPEMENQEFIHRRLISLTEKFNWNQKSKQELMRGARGRWDKLYGADRVVYMALNKQEKEILADINRCEEKVRLQTLESLKCQSSFL